MKIAYSHLVRNIIEKPGIDQISDKLFQLGHEHEIENNIFDIEFTPNRGDCLSIKGLLRDLAVFYTIDLKQELYLKDIDSLSIDFDNISKNICPQITFLKLEIDAIPREYKDYLNSYFEDLGINKNNFFTDISNYLSYETGQPTHCYDATKIVGKLKFHQIDHSQEFQTLLGKKIILSNINSVFSLNNKVINLAGVVGDKSTSCAANTKTVLIECAYFQPEAIIGKSIKYDIQSEASHKFERGVDPDCQEEVLRRFIKIISDHSNIKEMSIVAYKSEKILKYKIPIDVNKINQIIGINLNKEEYLRYILKLGFSIEKGFIVVPSFRNDIRTMNDLAEEVARVIGYNNIDPINISIPKNKNKTFNNIENKLRYFLLDHGFYEVINPPFVGTKSANSIKIDNPLDSNREYLRSNITDSLVGNLLYNEKRQHDSVKLFEISDIYSSVNNISKKKKLAILASGRVGQNFEDFSKKINQQYLARLFNEILPNHNLEFKLIPRDSLDTKKKNEIISLEVDIDSFSDDILSYKEKSTKPTSYAQYRPISEQPSSCKDISYSIKDFSKAEELQNLLLNYKNDILKNTFIFDYFYNEKNEEIKIGFRFIFQSKVATLTAAEVEVVYNDILNQTLCIEGVTIPGM
jgi:phenylalanyl-tRNA synthetase beta chain